MIRAHLLDLFAYEHWANQRVIEVALSVDSPPEKVPVLIAHILAARTVWLERLTETKQSLGPWSEISAEEWLPLLQQQEQQFREWLESREESDFQHPITYANSKGQSYQNTVLEILSQLALHASYHRGQVLQLLKPLVHRLPVTDYIFYKREKH